MHIFFRIFLVALCVTFSAPIQAGDFVSVVENNFPYQEVDESYGVASIQDGRCQEGTPFSIFHQRSVPSTKIDVAKQIHEELRRRGANAFVITDLKEDSRVRSVVVTPFTCNLR